MTEIKDIFPIGRIKITPDALKTLNREDIWISLNRHIRCDWGECSKQNAKTNWSALRSKQPLLSVYHDRDGTEFWIMTEGDRLVTRIILPSNY